MKEKIPELYELTDLVNKFIDFADRLKTDGKINDVQYNCIVRNKIEFLRENSNEYEVEKIEDEALKCDLYY